MGQYGDITFPEPVGTPPTESTLYYPEATALLPVERAVLQHLEMFANLIFDFETSKIKVSERTHTVVGHFTKFTAQNSYKSASEMMMLCFKLKESRSSVEAICYGDGKHPTSLELYSHTDGYFPNDALIQTATEIHI